VTVGNGVGIGLAGINESRGSTSGPLRTTLTTEIAETTIWLFRFIVKLNDFVV
jgi:hypothetical protein